MFRAIVLLLLLTLALPGATIKLYLTDGSFHLVREYEVKEDRVRFYSTERSQWEEIPLDLIDLKKTEAEIQEREETQREEIQFWEKEERAEREHEREVASVPVDSGVYWVDGKAMRRLPQAELDVKSDKKRSILQVITPIPIVAGKKTVLMAGEHAETIVNTATPEFYLRLFQEERFAIIRLEPQKGKRLVEEWAVAPVSNEVFEEHEDIEIFRRQVGDGLYKIWPKKPLEPGEYAVVEFSRGEANIQVWDFGYYPGGSPPSRRQ